MKEDWNFDKDTQGYELASGVVLEAPSKGMTEDYDLCSEAE